MGTGTAWTIERKGQWFGTNGFSLGANAEVYDPEIIGLYGGLEAALSSPMAGLVARPLTPNEILGTAQGVKMFAEWAPKTELFRRNRGYGEPWE